MTNQKPNHVGHTEVGQSVEEDHSLSKNNDAYMKEKPKGTLFTILNAASLRWILVFLVISLGVMGAGFLAKREAHTLIKVPILKRDLAAYQQIQLGDLEEKTFPSREVAIKKPLYPANQLENRYTLTNLSKNEFITSDKVSSVMVSTYLTNAVAIAFPATNALTLGGNLRAGDTVDISIVLPSNQRDFSSNSIQFSNVLVLDVKPESKNSSAIQANTPTSSESKSVVIVAIPQQCQQLFKANYLNSQMFLTRNLYYPPNYQGKPSCQ